MYKDLCPLCTFKKEISLQQQMFTKEVISLQSDKVWVNVFVIIIVMR